MKEKLQTNMFNELGEEANESWKKEWQGMPEFSQQDLQPVQQVTVSFETRDDMKKFAELIRQKLTYQTKSIWFPKITEKMSFNNVVYIQEKKENPKYPIYIISKGRADTRMTSKALESMGVPYHIVIEPQEYDAYAAVIDPKKILILPFSNLGMGSIPARNWVWEHSISIGAERHWILDDNIKGFIRFNRNKKNFVDSGITFKLIEDYVDRYENVAMAGMDYMYFAPARAAERMSPYTLNTRIYSCILLKNDVHHRWRGKFNEDTDLSLRILKDGLCTILFKAFLCDKTSTMIMKGGNTDGIYKYTDNRREFAESLVEQHPDVAKVVWRYERWHHEVDYSQFMKYNKLVKKEGLVIQEGFNEYGMILKDLKLDKQENQKGETESYKGESPDGNNGQDNKKHLFIKPEPTPDIVEEEMPQEIPKEIEQQSLFVESPTEPKLPYKGLYCVLFSYELQEKDSWDKATRIVGSKSECEDFIRIHQSQNSLF